MARQLRIEYPGAFYHITTRGNQRQPIFLAERDRSALLEYFNEAHVKFGAVIHAYCLMENHYHFVLETPRGNLSKIMHFINTSYTVYFNKKHSRVGHFLQGRYKAILVEKDTYALELSRYIHLNPVRAGIVVCPEEYPWSSLREYLGLKMAESWLETSFVLEYFGPDLGKNRAQYKAFVASALGQKVENPITKAGRSLILGSKGFIARIKKEFLPNKRETKEVPAIRGLKERPPLEIIQRSVEQASRAKNKHARNVAIFLCRKKTDYTLTEIAEFYRIGKSAVGKISGQMKEILTWNKTLEASIGEIEKSLFG
jgi:REP element-mobilizing transposase RayT